MTLPMSRMSFLPEPDQMAPGLEGETNTILGWLSRAPPHWLETSAAPSAPPRPDTR